MPIKGLTFEISQLQSISEELDLFVNQAEVEQEFQLSGILPSVEQYQERRMGTSAVTILLAQTEYALTSHAEIDKSNNLSDTPWVYPFLRKSCRVIS